MWNISIHYARHWGYDDEPDGSGPCSLGAHNLKGKEYFEQVICRLHECYGVKSVVK